MLNIIPIPAFQDNYLWVFHSPDHQDAFVVDPGNAEPIIHYLESNNLSLSGIFLTHHHADHIGGVSDLLDHKDVMVVGPNSENILAVTRLVDDGEEVTVNNHHFEVLTIPGHTMDHLAYFCKEPGGSKPPILFCGDTLFAGGCGRVFEGTHQMMYESLQKLAMLPNDTKVYCAHEYTLSNLRFAQAVLPECEVTRKRIEQETAKRNLNIPTVPTTITLEKKTNIFLRCEETIVKKAAELHCGHKLNTAEDVFSVIRLWKDSF